MERVYLEPPGIAAAPEPYSHAIRCGNTVYIAGQVAFDESNRVVGVGDARKQAERVWHNIRLAVRFYSSTAMASTSMSKSGKPRLATCTCVQIGYLPSSKSAPLMVISS